MRNRAQRILHRAPGRGERTRHGARSYRGEAGGLLRRDTATLMLTKIPNAGGLGFALSGEGPARVAFARPYTGTAFVHASPGRWHAADGPLVGPSGDGCDAGSRVDARTSASGTRSSCAFRSRQSSAAATPASIRRPHSNASACVYGVSGARPPLVHKASGHFSMAASSIANEARYWL